jgi:hypothetical protein
MGLFDRLAGLLEGDEEEERLASDPVVLDTGTAGAAPIVPEADELTGPDLRARAEEFADRTEGAGLGFTLRSLETLDEIAMEQPTVLSYLDGGVGDDRPDVEPGGRVLDFGSYMGEVLVAEFDGEWVDEDGWGVAITVGTEPVTVPVFDVGAAAVGGEPQFHEVGTALDDGEVPLAVERPTVGVRTAMGAAAEEVAAFWPSFELDFSPASLARLDDLVDAEWDKTRFRTARFGDKDPDSHVYTELVRNFGSYYGEVLVRNFDAEWTSDPDLGTVVDVAGRDGTAVANVFVVAADRLTGEERFALDFDVLAANLDLDAAPASEYGYEVVRTDPEALERVRGADPEAAAETFAEAAATLAGEFPDYDLDYSPASLQRLDELATMEFEPFDLATAELGGATDADSLVLTTRAMEAGGYLAAVFVRQFGGEWRPEDLEFVVRGRSSEVMLYPVGIAAECLRGEGSFAATYAAIDDQLDAPREEAGTSSSGGEAGGSSGGGGSAGGEATSPTAGDDGGSVPQTAAEHRELAATLAASWPDHELDYSVESLVRLDELAESEFAREDVDVPTGGGPLAVPADVPVTGAACRLGAYFGELLRRNHGGTWEGETLVVSGPDGRVKLTPARVAAGCLAGGSSLLDAYAHLAARTGLETPLG